jgi:hypothetical protein
VFCLDWSATNISHHSHFSVLLSAFKRHEEPKWLVVALPELCFLYPIELALEACLLVESITKNRQCPVVAENVVGCCITGAVLSVSH